MVAVRAELGPQFAPAQDDRLVAEVCGPVALPGPQALEVLGLADDYVDGLAKCVAQLWERFLAVTWPEAGA